VSDDSIYASASTGGPGGLFRPWPLARWVDICVVIPTHFQLSNVAVELLGWCGRMQSINNLVWESNYGGLWQYNFGEFIMQ